MEMLSRQQLSALCETSMLDIFGLDFFGVLAFHDLRVYTIVQALDEPLTKEAQFWRDY